MHTEGGEAGKKKKRNFATYGALLTANQQPVGERGRGRQVFAAGCTGWPQLCRGADGEPKLVVTLTFPAKSLIPPWTLLQGRFLEAEIGVTIWTGAAPAKTLTTHKCK